MEVHTQIIQRSARNLKLDFLVKKATNSCLNIVDSSSFEIGHLALVRFRFIHESRFSSDIKSSISYKIHKSQNDANVQITGTCNVGQAFIHFICSHDWSGYMDLCEHFPIAQTDMYPIKVNVNVTIMKPGPCRLLYQDDNFMSDFQLRTESADGSVKMHRTVMAAHSEVFKTMLSGEWKETAEGCLEVKGVTQQTLQHLKDYMYLGSLPEHDDLRPLLLIAKRYMMNHLEDACADKLALTVKPEDLQDLVKFAMDNHLSELFFSTYSITPHEVVDAAREATINQQSKPVEVEE